MVGKWKGVQWYCVVLSQTSEVWPQYWRSILVRITLFSSCSCRDSNLARVSQAAPENITGTKRIFRSQCSKPEFRFLIIKLKCWKHSIIKKHIRLVYTESYYQSIKKTDLNNTSGQKFRGGNVSCIRLGLLQLIHRDFYNKSNGFGVFPEVEIMHVIASTEVSVLRSLVEAIPLILCRWVTPWSNSAW